MAVPEVKNLEQALRPSLKSSEIVRDSEITFFTQPGENYASLVVRILAAILDTDTKHTRQLDMVAKLVPENDVVRDILNPSVTFKNEFCLYSIIIPLFDQLAKSKGLEGANFTVPYYGGRLNLDGGESLDDHAIILVKNLKPEGFKISENARGLNERAVKLTLDWLAKLHAFGLAVKLNSPEEFETKILPCCHHFRPSPIVTEMVYNNISPNLVRAGFTIEEIDKAKKAYANDKLHDRTKISPLWGTLIHNDTWLNNILIKHQGPDPEKCFVIDFQIMDYGTPLNDAIFFLFSCLQQDLLEPKLNTLLDYFYKKLMENLQQLDVDTTDYTKASFDEEIPFAIKSTEYYHMLWMFAFILNENVTALEDFKPHMAQMVYDWPKRMLERVRCVTRLCLERGWI